MTVRTLAPGTAPKTYKELAALWMPRPIHDEAEFQNAMRVIEAMVGFPLNSDQEDYLEAVSTFVERYEDETDPIEDDDITPVDLLRDLMDEHRMSESDLGRLLGDRSLGHRVLSGERELSKTHVRILAERFAMDPAAFLARPSRKKTVARHLPPAPRSKAVRRSSRDG